MERSYPLYAVTLRRLLLSAPLLIALSAPLAAHTQVQKTDERFEPAATAVDAGIQGPGAALGGIHGDVTGGPVGWVIDVKGGYILAAGGERDKEQQQLAQSTQQDREWWEWWERLIKKLKKDKDDKTPSPHKIKHKDKDDEDHDKRG